MLAVGVDLPRSFQVRKGVLADRAATPCGPKELLRPLDGAAGRGQGVPLLQPNAPGVRVRRVDVSHGPVAAEELRQSVRGRLQVEAGPGFGVRPPGKIAV